MVHFRPPGPDRGLRPGSARAEELAQGWDAIVDSWLTRAVQTSDGLFFNPAAPDAPVGEAVPSSGTPSPWSSPAGSTDSPTGTG